jgi:ATP-dependent exoDNAse (exonuclease V) beta subunit
MNPSSNLPLLVLNASAGSGKTYNLVRNYLVLLLKEVTGRADLGQIVAMTFTNKAAYEMKTRIIRDLNRLSHPTLADEPYVLEIAGLVNQKPDELQRNARLILRKMLHRYEDFNVLTIDKFNLRLIRSFSRDLNLPEQFDIVLDEQMILEKAVDELLSTIDKTLENRIYRLAINFATTNLDEETKWDVKRALIESAQILTDERSYQVIRKLVEKEFPQADYDLWRLQYKEYNNEIRQWQQRIQLALEQSGLQPDEFSDKSRTWNKIQKIVTENGNAADKIKSFEIKDAFLGHLEKTAAKTGQTEPYHTILEFAGFWNRSYSSYFELELKIRQFYLLSILRELAIFMENIREKDAVIRVSEFNKLVSELVKDEEAPFIYERLGSRFRHFFLDEFQDTSRLQWMNLVPLVHESLAHGQFNFIVGDPKQSIYRFKNGVAEQFVALPRIYNPEENAGIEQKSDFFSQLGSVEGLTDNWRSSQEIVRFNNAFFEMLKQFMPESGTLFYQQVEQVPRGKENGLVTFELIRKDDDSNDTVNGRLLEWVRQCIADGYAPSDICILAKRKTECNTFANHLKNNGYQVVSADSLLVNSDQYVQLIIAFCRLRNNPAHRQLLMRFAELFLRLFSPKEAFAIYQSCFEPHPETGKELFSPQLFFRNSIFDQQDLARGYQDIFSLIQTFIRRYRIDELQNAYVHQLLDMASQFDLHSGPDLAGFLSWYDGAGSKTNVQLPENRHSIRVMTAHKSKGLEFPVVIIPSLRFDVKNPKGKARLFESADHFVQSRLTEADRAIPAVEPFISLEKDAEAMDNVNLLYVAFTRPVDRLYFMGVLSPRTEPLQKHIFSTLSLLFPQFVQGDALKGSVGTPPQVTHEEDDRDEALVPVSLNDYLWFPDISIMSPEEQEENALSVQRRFGRQFHAVMEQSMRIKDVHEAIERGLLKGTIDAEFSEQLEAQAALLFGNTQYAMLVNNGVQLDEQTLLIDRRTRLRPDKVILHPDKTVVIDFKTGERKAEHRTQVSQYLFALNEMQYPAVEGYLYYVNENELVRIEM